MWGGRRQRPEGGSHTAKGVEAGTKGREESGLKLSPPTPRRLMRCHFLGWCQVGGGVNFQFSVRATNQFNCFNYNFVMFWNLGVNGLFSASSQIEDSAVSWQWQEDQFYCTCLRSDNDQLWDGLEFKKLTWVLGQQDEMTCSLGPQLPHFHPANTLPEGSTPTYPTLLQGAASLSTTTFQVRTTALS